MANIATWLKSRQHRFLPRFTLRQLGAGIAVIAVLLTIAVRFWPNLRWRLSASGQTMAHVTAIPVHDMTAMVLPKDWIATQVGQLELSLPAAVAESKTPLDNNFWHFQGGDIEIGTTPIWDSRDFRAQLQIMDLSTRDPRAEVKSVVDIQRDVYAAQASDFHWLMSRSALRRHQWLISLSYLSRPSPGTAIEVARTSSIEGLLKYKEASAFFDWFTLDGNNRGSVVFKAAEGKTLDLDFVRIVCQHVYFKPVASEVSEVEAPTIPPSPALPAEGRGPIHR
jgi:hypothetical protein